MQRLSKIALLGILCIYGCSKPGQVEFIQVVQDHNRLTQMTNEAVIASIQEELNDMVSSGSISDNDKKSIEELIIRLKLEIQQADIIEKYVNTTEINEEILSELLRSRWIQN